MPYVLCTLKIELGYIRAYISTSLEKFEKSKLAKSRSALVFVSSVCLSDILFSKSQNKAIEIRAMMNDIIMTN